MNSLSRRFIFIGSIMMALAVAIGAFGAHGLKSVVSKEMLVIYHTGVEYHFYHALGLFVVAFVANLQENKKVKLAGYFMLFGIFIFSGSLYALSITGIKLLGAITPIGGTLFIISWLLLAFSVKKS